jgi:hypothetical protein
MQLAHITTDNAQPEMPADITGKRHTLQHNSAAPHHAAAAVAYVAT